jgi:predicted MFS family arabinose efflux permease
MTATRPRHGGALLAVLLMAPFLAQVDATIANVATPAIQTDLGASSAAVELVVGGYLIAFAVLLITGARLGQTHGYKRIYMLGAAAFAASSLLGGLAPNATVLVAGRVLQGTSAALMFPQALTGIQLNFSGAQRARAIGLYAIALSSGAITGQALGGALITADLGGTGWRSIFLINVPVCAAILATAGRALPPDGRRDAERVHALGVATLSASVLLIVLPLTLGRVDGWPAWTWMSLAASGPVFVLFLLTQRAAAARGRSPLVNLHVLARPTIWLGLLTLMAATATYYALLFTLAQYLQHGLGGSALASGLVLVPWVAAFGLAGQITRRLPPRFGPVLPAAGCLLLAAAYLALSGSLFAGVRADAVLVPLLAAGGFGLGIQFSTLIGHLTNAVDPRYAPDISGTSTTTLQIGGALGVAAFGAIYLSLAAPAGAAPATHAFAVTALAMGATALAAAGTAWLTTRFRAYDEPERQPRSVGRPSLSHR